MTQLRALPQIKWFTRESCPVCGSKNWQKLFDIPPVHLYQCRDCALKFLNPCLDESSTASIYETSESLKRINPCLEHYYEETAEKIWQGVTGRDYRKTLDWLSGQVPGRKILDVACGNGLFLGFAKRSGWEVEGVDPSQKNADRIWNEFGVPVSVCNFLEYDRFDPQFDVVTFWDFIEHPPKPSLYVQKVRSHLKDKGVLVIATPNVDNLINPTAELMGKISGGRVSYPLKKVYTAEHACYFNLDTLTKLLDRNGFRVVHHFKTESHLERYQLAPIVKWGILAFFWANRLLGLQNRIVVFAVKK